MQNKKIEAKIVADSISPQGHRITSVLLTFPRFILAELNTHRLFSRNSASSRAIPFEKMVKMAEEDSFIPIAWQKDHKGMQGTEYLTSEADLSACVNRWLAARDEAIFQTKGLHGIGLTKQLCNRLLEPFMWHTVLVTATEWENFFELRCPKYYFEPSDIYFRSRKDFVEEYNATFKVGIDILTEMKVDHLTIEEWHNKFNHSQAEIHIQALAESMWDAMNESTPRQLEAGEWHIPFGDNIDGNLMVSDSENAQIGRIENIINGKVKIATARCARLSYMTFDGEIDYAKDIKLHDKLLKDRHPSPFEHCARAMSDDEYNSLFKGKLIVESNRNIFTIEGAFHEPVGSFGWCNNFRGWIQYRYLVENK